MDDTTNSDWSVTGIYGWPQQENKYRTWELMKRLHREIKGPWLCLGDFTEILWH